MREHLFHARAPASRPPRRPPLRRHRAPLLPGPGPAEGRPGVRHLLVGPVEISGTWRRGALLPPVEAPAEGERFEDVLRLRNLVVEQILSGRTTGPHRYLQAHDEWVVVLAGAAVLDVEGEQLTLTPGEWLFLPSGAAHTVLETEPGTTWLAVHLHP